MAKKELSRVPWPARRLMKGACGDPMIWSKEWFSSTTTMIRRGPATADRLADPAFRAVVVDGLVGVVPADPWPPVQPAASSSISPTNSVHDLRRLRPILALRSLICRSTRYPA
jgi:hypothetical protein